MDATTRFRLRSPRWLAALLPLILLAAAPGCSPEREALGPPADADHSTTGDLRLQETEIEALPAGNQLEVILPIHRQNGSQLQGQASVQLVRIADGEVLAADEISWTAVNDTTALRLHLGHDLALEDEATAAGYALHYRVAWGGQALWGRRSLFAALPLTETRLLGPAALQTGVPTYLRVLTSRASTGAPVPELPVRISWIPSADEGTPLPLFQGVTDPTGNLAARVVAAADQIGPGTLAVEVDAPERTQAINAAVAVEQATRILLTTDKPLYQPGQQIHLRALALSRPDLAPAAARPIVFEIFDGKGNKVEHVQRTTDAYGIASYIFRLAREVNMGAYKITAEENGAVAVKNVTVERYALPKYDVALTLDQEVYLAGSELRGNLSVQYFFGQPVRGGQVTVTAATLDAGATVFSVLQGLTDDTGHYSFQLALPTYVVGLPLEQGGGLVDLSITVTDTAGQSRSIVRTIRIARGPLEAVLVPESGELIPGLVNLLLVRTRDAAGQPVATHNELTINGTALPAFDTDGEGLAAVPVEVAGDALTVELVTTDDLGHAVTTQQTFTVGQSEGAVLLRTDRALYKVGDTLAAEVHTVGAKDRVYLDVLRGGQTVLTTILVPDGQGLARTTITLTPDHAGALQLEAYTLAGSANLRRDGKLVYVDRGDSLRIEVEPDRDVYRPGEEARLRFQVTDQAGVGQAAALGIQVVDEAVFSLIEFRPGLEKTYFEMETALGQPRYQVGVPSLPVLAADPEASRDQVRQDQARILFAAAGGTAGYPVAVNSFEQVQVRAQAVIQPLVQTVAGEYFGRLRNAVDSGWFNYDTLPQAIRSGFAATYDPWGQLLIVELDDSRNLRLTSRGLDERLGTKDDVQVSYWLDELFYSYRWDEDGGPWPGPMDGDWADEEAAMGGAGGPPNADGGEGEPASEGEGEKQEGNSGPRVRRNFPETLLVEPALITDGRGEAELTVPLADSITTWRLTALANSAGGLLGSTDAGVRVFQDFFVDIDFPATLTRKDEYSVPVAVYNYLDVPQTVRLEVAPAQWLTLLGPATQELELGPGEVVGVRIPVRVEQVGFHELQITALGTELQDAVARTVEVVPDGKEYRSSVTGRLEGTIRKPVALSDLAIPGSGKLLVKIYPGLLSQVVEGLDGVLQLPSGCFEQTSSSTWPNVLVTRYLRESGLVTPELDARASEYVNLGYQRLLTFEVDGGGFEWFGNAPANVVLTAYGLLEFTDMAAVRTVDTAMLERTRRWLLGQQQADGHWQITTRGLDETGNLSDPVTVTAYTAFALAAAGEQGEALTRAQRYLQSHQEGMREYTLALFANFMVHYQPDAALTSQLMDRLAGLVEEAVAQGGGQPPEECHWQTEEQTTTYGNGEPAWIETTALATRALLKAGAHPDTCMKALNWLVTRKDSRGAWGSTAGTVWSISSLLLSLGGAPQEADATVEVRLDGELQATFAIDNNNADVLRQVDLSGLLVPGLQQLVEVTMNGTGNLQYGIVEAHHEPWEGAPPPEGPLSISLSYDRTQLAVDDTVRVTVTIANNDPVYQDMVMVDLGIPPGFDLVAEDLETLKTAGVISRYESTQRQLLLYFTRLAPGPALTFAYRIIARDPIRAAAPPSRIYSYYNPEVGSGTQSFEVEVEE